MQDFWRDNRGLVYVTHIIGALVFLVGLTGLLGFSLNDMTLIQIHQGWEPMKMTSAVLFCMTGICLHALPKNRKRARVFSAFTAVIAISLLIYADTQVNSIFCFIGSSISILLLTYISKKFSMLRLLSVTVLAGAIMAGGFVALIRYMSGYSDIFPLNYTGKMAVHSAIAFLMMGGLLATLSIWASRRNMLWLPLPALFLMLSLVMPIMKVMEKEDQIKYKNLSNVHAVMTAEVTNEAVKDIYLAIEQLSRKWGV